MFNPTELGLEPNAREPSSNLFSNLTYPGDDGRTGHIDVCDTFSLPPEFIGFEQFLVAELTGLRYRISATRSRRNSKSVVGSCP
ncbi:MAG: hypothetical protein U0804_26075 [Gemmataceae bacterium]